MRPFTSEWADALCAAINDSESYRAAATGWKWPVALVLRARPNLGWESDAAVRLDLDRGTCREARVVSADEPDAAFVLRGDYDEWKRIVRGEQDPVVAVAMGRIALTGSITTLMMHVGSARALVACAQRVPTTFPDEARIASDA